MKPSPRSPPIPRISAALGACGSAPPDPSARVAPSSQALPIERHSGGHDRLSVHEEAGPG